MNGIIQQQHQNAVRLAGLSRNFRRVPTRTSKPMAVFTIGATPAKCFDLTVDQAERWADTGKKALITGQFSDHRGQIEIVAQNIGVAAPGQTDAQDDPGIAATKPQIRESSMIVENLSGYVSEMRIIPTHSNRPMITFKVGGTGCKALGDLATAIQKAEGKRIEISARKGSFQGVTEYAVTILKAINGTAVDLRDNFKPEPASAGPAASSSLIESIQQLMRESATLTEGERKQIADAVAAKPKAALSQTNDDDDIPGLEPFDPAAYGISLEAVENFRFLSEPAKPAVATTEAEPVTETTKAPEPVMESKPLKESLVQYWIDIIDATPDRYPEERMRELSLESGEEGEAARRIIGRYAAVDDDRAA